MDHCHHGTAWFVLQKAFFLIITSEYLTSEWAWYWCSDWSKLQLLVWISTDLLCSIIQGILDGSAIPLVNLHWLLLPILKHTQCDVVITPIIFLQILTIYTIVIIKYTPYPDTMKLSGPRPLADKRWVGPVKLLCIIMFDISKIRPKSILRLVKAQKFSRCLHILPMTARYGMYFVSLNSDLCSTAANYNATYCMILWYIAARYNGSQTILRHEDISILRILGCSVLIENCLWVMSLLWPKLGQFNADAITTFKAQLRLLSHP